MTLDDTYTHSADVVARTVGDETVLLALETSTYLGLDPVGSRIWQLIGQGKPLSAVCTTMLDEYDVTRETIERDVLGLAAQMLEKKLLVPA